MTDPSPNPGAAKRGCWYWLSRIALIPVSILVLFGALEGGSYVVCGTVFYPLPAVEEAAQYLYFTLPERFNPLFEYDAAGDEGDEGDEGDKGDKGDEGDEGDEGGVFRTVPELYGGNGYFVRDQAFPAQRADDGLRVAFLGGSSVQGWPYRQDDVVFPELVQAQLQERMPERRVDLINAGVGSYSSFQLVDVAYQMELFDPDVVVVYTGHNDQGYYFFQRNYLDEIVGKKKLDRALNSLNFWQCSRLRRDRLARESGETLQTIGPDRVSNEQGVAFVPEDSQIDAIGRDLYTEFVRIQQTFLPQLFEKNLTEVVRRLNDADTTVVLVKPVSNLRDFPPAFSMHWESVSDRVDRKVRELTEEAAQLMGDAGVGPRRMPGIENNGENMDAAAPWAPEVQGDPLPLGSDAAIAACAEPLLLLNEAKKLSESYALTWFLEGSCLMHSDRAAARQAFEQARDLSPAMAPKQRAGAPLLDVVDRVGAAMGVTVVDPSALFVAESEAGVPDGTLFVDNLHFSAKGHRVLANAVMGALEELPVVRDGPVADRPADLAGPEFAKQQKARAGKFVWGMGLELQGAGAEPVK